MSTVKGDLASIGVPEIFRAIASEDRTGRLVLRRGASEAQVFFRDGDAYHARMLSNQVRLGERLVSAGMLSHEELAETLEMQRSDSRGLRLGQLLIERGLVDTEGLAAIVRQQIEDTIFELLRWDGGTFEFETEIESDEDIGLQVSVENLVMEGARRFREWHQITRKLPSMEAVPRLNDDDDAGIEVALTPEEWALISRVNGRATVVELANACGFTELEAARCVFGLLTTGVLKITLPEGVEVPPEDPALEEMFDELEKALQESARDRSSEGVSHPTLEELVGAPAPMPAAIEEASSELPGFDALPLIADEERFARAEEEATAEIIIEDDHPVDDLVIAAENEDYAPVEVLEQPPEIQLEVHPQQDEASQETSSHEEIKAWYDEPTEVGLPSTSIPVEDPPAVEDGVVEPVAWYDEPVEIEPSIPAPDLEVVPDTALAALQPEEEEADDLPQPVPEPQLSASASDWGHLQPAVPAPEPSLSEEQSATVLVEEQVRPVRGINGYARMFSELSMSDEQAGNPEPVEEPEKKPDPETPQEPINATKRPVDPSVDTTALLREFSGLTDEVSEDALGTGTFEPITRSPASIADEKRGIFGKKKR